jgi:hypothetical protein
MKGFAAGLALSVAVVGPASAAALAPAPAPAPNDSGPTFVSRCRSGIRLLNNDAAGNDNLGALQCLSYIDGFLDANGITHLTNNGKQMFCLPEHFSVDEATRVVVKWADANPEQLHQGRRMIVMMALMDTYSCPAPK